MSERPRDRVQELFDQAVALPPAQRAAFLEAACGNDWAFRAEVESLLAFDAEFRESGDEGRLKSPLVRSPDPAATGASEPALTLSPQDLVTLSTPGRYRIVRRIAEGGMGAVYEAEQDNPRRTVALKVIRPGLASPALVKRFSHEAQILGRLHHLGIAQVYEAGLAHDGQPFFAMEFIRGQPLDEYARCRGLDLRARVGLVARVCDAVQHAHDQGVIHRDLKPANILVNEAGQPKVLDFGVARVTDSDLLTAAGLTQTGQWLGTPSYMSPEQVTADPDAIDHRTDVYSLGVILFELAAHRLPYQLENRPLIEAARLILEQDPPTLGSIHARLRGDVETIVARALEKDPARRYPTAAVLAADLRRWLVHEPILARPPSTLYQLGKFARRHKTLVGGVVATVLALVLGLIGTIFFAVGEARQRGQAEHHAKVANAEKREALFQAYRARLSAAVAALQNHDVLDAARHLDAAPKELRGWEWRHLSSRLDDSAAAISLPAAGDGYLLAAPDRIRIGAWTSYGLRLNDLKGRELGTLPFGPQRQPLDTVAQTCRGLRVVLWTGKATFNLLDEAGQVLSRVEVPELKAPCPVVVSPDGTRLACRWSEGGRSRIALFDATSGQPTAGCIDHPGDIRSLTFSPDGTRLGSTSGDRAARLWDSATGTLLVTCRGHTDKLLSASFSADGTRLVTTSSDATVRQWDTATGREVEAPYDRHTGEVITAVYSPDGQWIASAGTERTIRVWRATGRQDVAILLGHTGGVIGVAFDPSGRRLASLSDNNWLRYAGDDTVRVWDVDPGATLPALRGHTGPLFPVAFGPDGRSIASGDGTGSVRLWDAATGEPCAILPHPGHVWSLAYSPDGRWLATATGADNRVRIWDVTTARLRKEITVPGRSLFYVIVSPDGKRVTASTLDPQTNKPRMHVCDVTTGERLVSAEGWALAYSPDGRWLAGQAADAKVLFLMDAQTYKTTAQFRGHDDFVFKVAFSPDSRRLASCSGDRTIRLWQIDNGACQVLRGHSDEVQALAFHPDGTRLASGGEDRTVLLWDLARGEEVARLQGHTGYVWSVAFSPDGATLTSGSGDTTIRLWDTAPLKARYLARREAEALRPEAERLEEQLWRQWNDPAKVGGALRLDKALSEPLRQASLRALLRRALPSASITSSASDPP